MAAIGGPIVSGPGTQVGGSGGGIIIRRHAALVALEKSEIYGRSRSRFTFPNRREQLQAAGLGLDIDSVRLFGALETEAVTMTTDPQLTLE